MSKPKVARKPPKKVLLPLASLTIRRVEDFSGKPAPAHDRERICTDDVALALDFLQRINWRRTEKEKKDWIDPEQVTDRLHTLRRVMQAAHVLLGTEEIGGASDYEVNDLMADAFEYLTIRAELAGETGIPRERRYRVTVDGPVLAAAPTRKAVA